MNKKLAHTTNVHVRSYLCCAFVRVYACARVCLPRLWAIAWVRFNGLDQGEPFDLIELFCGVGSLVTGARM